MAAPISFGAGLNTGLTGAALQITRFQTLVNDCAGPQIQAMGNAPTNAQCATAYNWLVPQLVTAGFTTADADEAAQACIEAYVAASSNGNGTVQAAQLGAVAALTTMIGLLSMPACAGECPTSIVAAMSAALAQVSTSTMVSVAVTMWNALINAGLIG